MPGLLDVAQFGLSPPPPFFRQTYSVSFNNNATNQALHIEDDLVTFNLNSRTYTLTTATGMLIGTGGFAARLTVNGGTITSTTGSNFDVGAAASSGGGTLIVSTNGLVSGSPNLNIGKLVTGTLTVDSGGDISTTGSTTIGVGRDITATATVFGEGSTLVTGALNVGSVGNGTINVQLGGLLQNSGGARLGTGNLFTGVGTGIVNVMNAGSTWNSLGLLEVGDGGFGEVNITLGGTVNGADSIVGSSVNGGGEVHVDGMSSRWDSSGTVTIGELGFGTLNITNQGVVENTTGVIGSAGLSTSNGTVNVSGAGSRWRNDELLVGYAGTGTLDITGAGTVQSGYGYVGVLSSGTGTATVDGTGSVWDTSDDLFVGYLGDGTLSITAGGFVQDIRGFVGNGSSGVGHVTVDGGGSFWESSNSLTVGNSGDGTLEITGGGHVLSGAGFVEDVIGSQAGSTGLVTVDGIGSLWENFGNLIVGDAGDGTLNITGRGTVQSPGGRAGVSSSGTGHITVDGDGSVWKNLGDLRVGNSGFGTLEITAGGTVASTTGSIATLGGSMGMVTVDGENSVWTIDEKLFVGDLGNATLNITGGGRVSCTDAIMSNNGQSPNPIGTVTVAGANSTWYVGGRLVVGGNQGFGDGGVGTLRIQPGGTVNVTENTSVSLNDLLSLEGGTLSTTAIDFRDGGTADTNFEWTSGTLHVGFFDGDLVNQSGILAPGNSVGSTIIDGNYNQLADATLQIEIGGPSASQNDDVIVQGNAFLGGNLELALVNGFVPVSVDVLIILRADLNVFGAFDNVANGQRLTTTDGLGSFRVHYGPGSAFDSRQIVLTNFLSATPGDCDIDGRVDLNDCTPFPNCMGGPGVPYGPPECECVDLNADGDVDLSDFADFQSAFTGP